MWYFVQVKGLVLCSSLEAERVLSSLLVARWCLLDLRTFGPVWSSKPDFLLCLWPVRHSAKQLPWNGNNSAKKGSKDTLKPYFIFIMAWPRAAGQCGKLQASLWTIIRYHLMKKVNFIIGLTQSSEYCSHIPYLGTWKFPALLSHLLVTWAGP